MNLAKVWCGISLFSLLSFNSISAQENEPDVWLEPVTPNNYIHFCSYDVRTSFDLNLTEAVHLAYQLYSVANPSLTGIPIAIIDMATDEYSLSLRDIGRNGSIDEIIFKPLNDSNLSKDDFPVSYFDDQYDIARGYVNEKIDDLYYFVKKDVKSFRKTMYTGSYGKNTFYSYFDGNDTTFEITESQTDHFGRQYSFSVFRNEKKSYIFLNSLTIHSEYYSEIKKLFRNIDLLYFESLSPIQKIMEEHDY